MMSKRDDELIRLRPAIPAIVEENAVSMAERFQNETLRPLLKMQNELLLEIFRHYIAKRKNVFYQLPKQKRPAYIEQSLRQDLKFRNYLTGVVAGHFTLAELEIFQSDEQELSRRIANLIVQRLCDQMEAL